MTKDRSPGLYWGVAVVPGTSEEVSSRTGVETTLHRPCPNL